MKKPLSLFAITILFGFNVLGQNCLVADYPFNGNANDQSGNGHHATVYGASLTTDRFGNPNSAYKFDGVNDYINTFTTFDYLYRTASVWFKADNISGINPNDHHILTQDAVSLQHGILEAKFYEDLFSSTAGGGSTTRYIDPSLNTNTWYHLTLVKDSSDLQYFLNGKLVATRSSNNIGSITYPYDKLVIGTSRTKNDGFFDGVIDDIKIYNCALSDSLIQDLYNAQNNTPGNDTCIVSVYDTIPIFDTISIVIYDTITTTVTIYDTIAVTDTLIIDVPTGLSSPNDANKIKVYPNPTNNLIFIDNGNLSLISNQSLKIMNDIGQQVFSSPINVPFFTVDLSQFGGSGTYFIQILDLSNQIIQEKKIILQ